MDWDDALTAGGQDVRTVKLSEIPPDPPTAGPFYHRSGARLVRDAETLGAPVRDRMIRAGIAELCVLDPGEDERQFRLKAQSRKVLLSELTDGTRLRTELRDAAGGLLSRAGAILDAGVRALLLRNGIQGFYVRRNASELGLDEVEMFRALSCEAPVRPVPVDDTPLPPGDRRLGKEWTEGLMRSWIEPPAARSAAPFADGVSSAFRMTMRGPEHRLRYLHLYELLLRDVGGLCGRLKTEPSEPATRADGIVRRILGALAEDGDLLLNLVNWKARGAYRPSHALHMAILCASMGITLLRSHEEVFELALSGLLARMGMLGVPEAVLEKPGPLTQAETAVVRRAPAFGLTLLRKIDWLPVRVVVAAYQCMERADGSGYPQGLAKERIHRQSGVIAVADVYDALLAARPYRSAMIPYRAMETVLRLVREGKLDGQAVRALLDTLSLFPVGSWVELSDRRIARVVAATRGQHTRPVVTAMFAEEGNVVEPERIDLAAQTTLSVVRAAAREDFDAGTLAGW